MTEQATQVAHADQVRRAREHYERVSMEANDWSSLIPKCIDAFSREPEFQAQVETLRKERDEARQEAAFLRCHWTPPGDPIDEAENEGRHFPWEGNPALAGKKKQGG